MSAGTATLLEAGQVIGTHGLRGDIKVRCTTVRDQDLLAVEAIYLRRPGGAVEALRLLRRSLHKGNVLLRLAGYESLSAVETLVGSEVLLDGKELPELPEGEFRFHEIVGLQVVDKSAGLIGRLVDSFTTAAHETLVVEGEAGEVLIPAVPQMIVAIDHERQVMEVDLPEGLLTINQ